MVLDLFLIPVLNAMRKPYRLILFFVALLVPLAGCDSSEDFSAFQGSWSGVASSRIDFIDISGSRGDFFEITTVDGRECKRLMATYALREDGGELTFTDEFAYENLLVTVLVSGETLTLRYPDFDLLYARVDNLNSYEDCY